MTQKEVKTPVTSYENWLAILEIGRYAPTPHNTQWYFLHPINDETAKVGIDSSIQLPFTDPADQFRFTGLGVFVRHLELAAQAVGFNLETSFNVSDGQYPVTVRIKSKQPPDSKLSNILTSRQTSRLAYRKEAISNDAIIEIEKLTDGRSTAHISTNESVVTSILNLNNQVLLNDLQDKGVGNELDTWIRYSKQAQVKHPSGFTPDTLATSAWKLWLVFKFRKVMLIEPFKKWLTRQYFKQNMTATVGWLYGPLTTRENQYDAGRYMRDIWIKVTELGYYMQPYGSIITNDEARSTFLADINLREENGNMVWLAFRIGTSAKPAQSPRKSKQEYIR